ncbi:efflux RND transporter periplasmic adaptor subunit [Synechococcus sp. UW140]|uniref:efflux RND transporter periplasmic adaptor subunit n=1 Tax=Synechococcus sp. UW140 TaxID=368503 RepID=UPI000E0F9BF6|nr:efflux RND transporter periplasmic adaptor subunit [Synechococcus sp. UW140]
MHRQIPVLALLPSVILLASCSHHQHESTFLSVNTARIKTANFQPRLQAISLLESTSNVVLKPESEGRVVKIMAREGQRVKAGETILVLDNVQQSASLNASKAQARTDRLNAERYEFLYQQGAASAKQRDRYVTQAIASRDKALADAATLGYKYVRSPIDGIVGDLDTVKLGDYVKTGQSITGIVENTTLWTLMQIPASQADAVKAGQTVKVASQTDPPVTGRGEVTFISPYFGLPGSKNAPNTVMVKATFPNLTGQLKTGQYVKSEIITGEQEQLAVPVQAVMMQAQQPFVYRLVPVKQALPAIKASAHASKQALTMLEQLPGDTPIVIQTKVELGGLQNNHYPVKSGLQSGDQVAVSNTSRLRNGMPVKVNKRTN